MIIDLTNRVNSDVPYEKIKYPDSQVSIYIDSENIDKTLEYNISSRMNSYEDLMYILGTTDRLRHAGVEHISLYVPCFMAQRSDRRFREEGQSFDLGVIANIINSQNYTAVTVMHAHSDVLPGIINKCHVLNNHKLVRCAIIDIAPNVTDITLVSPDAGAYKKVGELGKILNMDVIAANKFRTDGNINMILSGSVKDKTCLIVDDYCDGGRTFIHLAQELLAHGAKEVYLCVTHALFSAGTVELQKVLKGIYTTNSIQDLERGFIKQITVF